MAVITTSPDGLLLFNEIKSREALRVKKRLTHENFLLFLLELYRQVEGDTVVFNTTWDEVEKTDSRKGS